MRKDDGSAPTGTPPGFISSVSACRRPDSRTFHNANSEFDGTDVTEKSTPLFVSFVAPSGGDDGVSAHAYSLDQLRKRIIICDPLVGKPSPPVFLRGHIDLDLVDGSISPPETVGDTPVELQGDDSLRVSLRESFDSETVTDSEGETLIDIPEEFDLDEITMKFIRRAYMLPREILGAVIPPKDPSAPRNTLVLDLDETLVHCSTEFMPDAEISFPVMYNGDEYSVYARKRPFLEAFLAVVSDLFEVIVFTASQQVYADRLLNIIDPSGTIFSHRVFREACVNVEGNYLKDLTVLDRDLSSTVIMDNSPQAFSRHPDNGIPITSWFDDPEDAELQYIVPFLRQLAGAADVRPLIREKFKLSSLLNLPQLD